MQAECIEDDENALAFARNLRAARVARKLSQRQLGKLAGCGGALISRYETGSHWRAISLRVVLRLARALRVHLAWLLAGEGVRDLDAPVIVVQVDASAPARLRELADQLERGLVTINSHP